MFKIKAFFITTLFARSLTCDRWHFTHMWKTFAWPHHFNKRESLAHEASLTPPHFIEVSVPGKDGERLYICVLGISILSFLRNFYWILELLCGIFFYFYFLFFFFSCYHHIVVVIIRYLDLQLPVKSVPSTTNVVSSNTVHGEVYLIQHYVIKVVSDLRQVGGFLRIL
jgi:hypothetical protein